MGVAILNGWPANSGAASFSEIRRASEGDFARNAAGVVRAGILPAHTDPIVTARATMGVNVGDFRAVLNRDGAIRIANVGTKVVPLAAAPAANRRIDIVVATQFDPAAPLSDAAPSDGNWAFLEVVQGTASATPVKPALPSRLNGALELATIEVPAGATTTQSAGVIITQTAPYTATSGGVVTVRSRAELATWTPADGAEAFCLEDKVKYVRTASTWAGGGTLMHLVSGSFGVQGSASWTNLTGSNANWALQGLGMGDTPFNAGLVAPWSGLYRISGSMRVATNLSVIWGMKLDTTATGTAGLIAFNQSTSFVSETLVSYGQEVRLAAGAKLTPCVYTTGTLGPYGISGGAWTRIALEFIRP